MMWLRSLNRLYALDTLDTRFVISSTTPPSQLGPELRNEAGKSTIGSPPLRSQGNGRRAEYADDGSRSPLWRTPEFYVYYSLLSIIIPLMFKQVYDVSKETHPNYPKFAHLLSNGWIPGRKVDNSDAQYASFRNNIPIMFIVVFIHPLLRKLYDYICRAGTYTTVRVTSHSNSHLTQGLSMGAAADARLEQRTSFDIIFALIFITILHGFSAIKILLVLGVNYKISKSVPRAYIPAVTWVFNVGLLFANDLCHGYPYAMIWRVFFFRGHTQNASQNWGIWLDSHGGIGPRWDVLFNFSILRTISFSMDYYWSLKFKGSSLIEKKQLDPSNLSERDRVATPAKPGDYCFRNYLAYTLYSPLYLAGPIITFNDYLAQLRYRPKTINLTRTTMYGIRFLISLLTMEIIIHFMYMVAIFHAKPTWDAYTPFQLSMLGYFNLNHIWLKLLLPWRFFRFWALLDGIDPPENMVRCMNNNFSALAFWRSWHRSFNKWTIRYIYIPLGGSGQGGLWGKATRVFNFLTIFTFIAVWHDIQLRLLMWGWLVTLFVLPEIIASSLFPARKWKDRPNTYRMICATGAVANIFMMMAANLVGFAIGLDGLKDLIAGIFESFSGLLFLLCACIALFMASHIMFEVRESELRKGIRMKC